MQTMQKGSCEGPGLPCKHTFGTVREESEYEASRLETCSPQACAETGYGFSELLEGPSQVRLSAVCIVIQRLAGNSKQVMSLVDAHESQIVGILVDRVEE